MNAADALREFITPLLPGWRIQFGRWTDGNVADRYAVILPIGGLPAELVRRPLFTILLVGAKGEALSIASDAADGIVEATRASSGSLVLIQASEPIGPKFTTDDRPMLEIPISTITT
ncbi:hypothetical protein [Roseateles sp.]|uniref:phage tail termination protein n=1 Tax=Roseateles sp. TaxID=1971397 RepID=UPI0031E236E3